MEWDRIGAVDLLHVLNSFLDESQSIKKVSIFPTNFGLEQLKLEKNGPVLPHSKVIDEVDDSVHEIRVDIDENEMNNYETDSDLEEQNDSASNSSDSDADSDSELSDDEIFGITMPEIQEKVLVEVEDNANTDEELQALREYELNRLKYYFALVETDSVETAIKLYKMADGCEFETSSNVLQCQYVTMDVIEQLKDREPVDVAREVPLKYKPPKAFATRALGNTNVELSYDLSDSKRDELISRAFEEGELDETGLRMILASDDEDDIDYDQVAKNRSLLLSGLLKEDKQEKSTTRKSSASLKEDEFFAKDDKGPQLVWSDDEDDEMTTKSKNVNNMVGIQQKDKSSKKKSKKEKKREKEQDRKAKEQENAIDIDDRFSEIFSNPELALDTTSKHYKDSATNRMILSKIKEDRKTKEAAEAEKVKAELSRLRTESSLKSTTNKKEPKLSNAEEKTTKIKKSSKSKKKSTKTKAKKSKTL
eukprot:TRINITY_DN2242_c0_g1_i1.p1 TRINITY_DN2242_c0_g1~~TRINITY_DN2242_c0_g1_i1.p1  ORF type:complete len:507 (-),score=192.72 TRINITY_DN2242_c0_g1_i1:83-1516(-)